jgi:hypothetical protein
LRSAEFGFLGVVVKTFKHTPRLKGDETSIGRFLSVLKYLASAGAFDFALEDVLPLFIN